MSKKKAVEIVCILDRSMSMSHLTEATIEGFNAFIEKQRKLPGKARVSLVLFNHEYQLVYADKSLKKVKNLNRKTYVPAGTTALLDAVGRTIEEVRDRQNANNGAPDKTVVCIITDGLENASEDYTKDGVRKLIEDHQERDWDFFFLGANIDSFAEAGGIGIPATSAANYEPTRAGTKHAYAMASAAVTSSRTGDDDSDVDWKTSSGS